MSTPDPTIAALPEPQDAVCLRCGSKEITAHMEQWNGVVIPVQLVCTACGAEGARREPH